MAKPETAQFIERVRVLRKDLDVWSEQVRKQMQAGVFETQAGEGENYGEAKANIMLAYRHLEDARMRLGKSIQAMDGGVSCYDKGTPP